MIIIDDRYTNINFFIGDILVFKGGISAYLNAGDVVKLIDIRKGDFPFRIARYPSGDIIDDWFIERCFVLKL